MLTEPMPLQALLEAYAQMAADEAREAEAEEWADALLPEVAEEAQ